ncbi:MAG: hypothetical protein PHR16_15390 [Methylovulum sp.]|nr:hypothetical protein [Methylovulum sp.]
MITKQRYIEYLISTPINHTCYNLSEHLENVSHDVVGNFLERNRITAREVWVLANGLIKNTPESFLIIDDSVQDKQYSKSIGLVKKLQWRYRRLGARDWRTLRGINGQPGTQRR